MSPGRLLLTPLAPMWPKSPPEACPEAPSDGTGAEKKLPRPGLGGPKRENLTYNQIYTSYGGVPGGPRERPGEVLGSQFWEHFGRARAEDQKYIKIMPFLVCGRRVFEDVFACSRTVCLERAGKAEVEKIIDFHCIL